MSNWVIEIISLVVLYEPCGFVKKFNRNLGNIVFFFFPFNCLLVGLFAGV